MKRLRSFLSKKEKEVVEHELQSNHAELWEKNNKSLKEFFGTCPSLHDYTAFGKGGPFGFLGFFSKLVYLKSLFFES